MFRFFARLKSSIAFALFLGVFALNQVTGPSPILGGILLFVYLFLGGRVLGNRLTPNEHPTLKHWLGSWMMLSLLILEGAIAYYLFPFTQTLATVLLTLPILLCLLLEETPLPTSWRAWIPRIQDTVRAHTHHVPRFIWIASAGILFFLFVAFDLLRTHQTLDPIRSLWLVVPPSIFLAFGCAFLLLAGLLFRGRERTLTLPLVCVALGLCLAIPTIIFPMGYGFDPFIHRATVSHIAEFGTITPKPAYYAGQYGLELLIHLGFGLPIDLIDKILVPLLAALFLPFAWYGAAVQLLHDKRIAAGSLILLFLLPWSNFAVTTPQALANLWMFLLVLASVPYLAHIRPPFPLTLLLPTLAILATHPIAGLPALFFLVLILSEPARTNIRLRTPARFIYGGTALLAGISLPVAFAVNRARQGNGFGLDISGLAPSRLFEALHLDLFLQNRFQPLLDLVYLFGENATLFLCIIALIGLFRAKRLELTALRAVLLASICVGINYLLLSTAVDFSFLIIYEREAYAARLVPLLLFFLSPFLLLGFGAIVGRLRTSPLSVRAAAIMAFATLLTINVYLSFPRHDAYVVGRGFNTGIHDFTAVEQIAQNADGRDYLVLANQSVSAAALETLGFFRYYGEQFAYPVPTGNPLYARFLAMNESPNRATALESASLAEASCKKDPRCQSTVIQHVYYVVNGYWWQAERLRETAKTNADQWWILGSGDASVAIFRYDLSP